MVSNFLRYHLLATCMVSGISANDLSISPVSRAKDILMQPNSSMTASSDLDSVHGFGLFTRQQLRCVDPGYVPCPNIPNSCCAATDTCVPGGCCTRGYQTCSAGSGCYPPDSVCCADGTACPSDTTCQTSGCCPTTSETCGGKSCLDAGAVCCGDGTACPKGTECCGSGCCPAGSQCDKSKNCVERTTKTATSKYTSCPPIPNSNGKPTFTIPFYTKATKLPGGSSATIDNREIMQNMCDGIKNKKKCVGTQMELTYDTPDKQSRRDNMCPEGTCKEYNQPCSNSAGPGQKCNPYANILPPGVFEKLGSQNPFRFNCDEFPFASSVQGGDPSSGSVTCVPGYSNSAQGQRLRDLKSKVGEGNNYIVELGNWDCDSNRPLTKRILDSAMILETRDTSMTQSISESDFFNNVTDAGESGLQVYFGDIDAGTHSSDLNIATGTFSKAQVIDYLGFILAEVADGFQASSTKRTVTFTIDKPAIGVALWLYTRDTNVSLSYQVSDNTTSGPPHTSGGVQMQPMNIVSWGFVLGILGFLVGY